MIRKIFIIARLTTRELLSERVLYIIAGLCLLFFCLLSFLNYFDQVEQVKIVQDLGVTLLSFFVFILVLFGVPTVIHSGEESSRDILFITKPVSRADYITGKTLGLLGVMTVSLACLALIVFGVIIVRCGTVERVVFAAAYLLYLKYSVFLVMIVLISSVCNPLVVFFAGSAVFFFASASAYFETLARQMGNVPMTYGAMALKIILPQFDRFNATEAITMHAMIPAGYLLKSTGYACLYAMVMLIALRAVYTQKEF